MTAARALAVALALMATSCKDKEPARPSAAEPAGAMCEEHGVPEAVCTKCNPELVAVFKGKGDWCAEHGLPESYCPICHPERGAKPAADVAAGDAPAHGTKVRFRTKEAARLAGIEVVAAKKHPGGARLEAVATVVYDATRHAEVNARAPGVVKKLSVAVGAVVKEGAPLATVESAAVGADRSRLRAALARSKVARAEYDRDLALRDKGISTEREVLAARRALQEASADVAAARAALRMVGTGGGQHGTYVLRSPLAGIVTARKATIGHMVDTDEVLFEVVDTSSMWVEIDVPENRLSLIGAGRPVEIALDAMPGRRWKGVLDYVAPAVDPRTRTAKARVALKNPDGLLRANMYGRAFIAVAAPRPAVMVPSQAVQRAGQTALVFVKLAEDVFEARRVKIGLREGGLVELREGVQPGELVATRGSFLLKTETLKGSIGAGCCDVE